MSPQELARLVRAKGARRKRLMVAIAGAPGSGKSTLAAALKAELGATAIVVPMDGYHFDDAVLNARGQRARKGAPHTFDVAGFEALLKRIRAREPDVAIPVFDRAMELSRAGAEIIGAEARIIIVEGNYLLLKQKPWSRLKRLFDLTVFLKVPEAELERRLLARWRGFGFDETAAREKALGNDIPNARLVASASGRADLIISAAP